MHMQRHMARAVLVPRSCMWGAYHVAPIGASPYH